MVSVLVVAADTPLGCLQDITLICGNENRMRYFNDQDIFENVKQLKDINENIFFIVLGFLSYE